MPDEPDTDINGQGCLQPLFVLLCIVALLWLLSGCRTCPCPPDMAAIYSVLSAP